MNLVKCSILTYPSQIDASKVCVARPCLQALVPAFTKRVSQIRQSGVRNLADVLYAAFLQHFGESTDNIVAAVRGHQVDALDLAAGLAE